MRKKYLVMTLTRHANRGADLEEWVEQANRVYLSRGRAVITKIPTPWKVQRHFSPVTKRYTIQGAFPEQKSTVDFGGTAKGQSIWFDAKATKNKRSFPLANIHDHQVTYLKNVAKQDGKAFFLIHSHHEDKTWILWIDQLLTFKSEAERKSIPFTWLDDHCEQVDKGLGVMLDYLPVVLRRNEG